MTVMSEEWARQDVAIQSLNRNAEKVVVFLIPPTVKITGGVISFFSLCAESRKLCGPDDEVLLATLPGPETYSSNEFVDPGEKIFRWSQLSSHFHSVARLILHIPAFNAGSIFTTLTEEDSAWFERAGAVHMNILNQHIGNMPPPQAIEHLRDLADELTQTTAHDRYSTQDLADRYDMPVHHFSTWVDPGDYPRTPAAAKEQVFLFSKDIPHLFEPILELLLAAFPTFDAVVVEDMTYADYLKTIATAKYTVAFGEGFDGYFVESYLSGGIGFAIYNDDFFPSPSYRELLSVFSSYDELVYAVVNTVKTFEGDPSLYESQSNLCSQWLGKLYDKSAYRRNLRRFLSGAYDYVPK